MDFATIFYFTMVVQEERKATCLLYKHKGQGPILLALIYCSSIEDVLIWLNVVALVCNS